MDIEIRRLTPDLAEDYVRFFDETPHYHDEAEDFRGPIGLYRKMGFEAVSEVNGVFVMRKNLK